MSFQISSLSKSQFENLFSLNAEELAKRRAVRMVVDKKSGFPCRVSLVDAELGEEVILLHYEHQSAATPFRSSHAIYVRPKAAQAELGINEVPDMLRSRALSLRGFDETGMLIAADLVEGMNVEACIDTFFENTSVAYIHAHFAKPGCYAARIDRCV